MNQKHTNRVIRFEEQNFFSEIGYDGMLVDAPGSYGIYTADCVPIILKFPGGACILHAGWKGLVERIVPAAFQLIEKEKGFLPRDCKAWVGPHISANAYRIVPKHKGGDGREELFFSIFGRESFQFRGENMYLDLLFCVKKELEGLAEVEIDGRCTFADKSLPSYYRERTNSRILSVITI